MCVWRVSCDGALQDAVTPGDPTRVVAARAAAEAALGSADDDALPRVVTLVCEADARMPLSLHQHRDAVDFIVTALSHVREPPAVTRIVLCGMRVVCLPVYSEASARVDPMSGPARVWRAVFGDGDGGADVFPRRTTLVKGIEAVACVNSVCTRSLLAYLSRDDVRITRIHTYVLLLRLAAAPLGPCADDIVARVCPVFSTEVWAPDVAVAVLEDRGEYPPEWDCCGTLAHIIGALVVDTDALRVDPLVALLHRVLPLPGTGVCLTPVVDVCSRCRSVAVTRGLVGRVCEGVYGSELSHVADVLLHGIARAVMLSTRGVLDDAVLVALATTLVRVAPNQARDEASLWFRTAAVDSDLVNYTVGHGVAVAGAAHLAGQAAQAMTIALQAAGSDVGDAVTHARAYLSLWLSRQTELKVSDDRTKVTVVCGARDGVSVDTTTPSMWATFLQFHPNPVHVTTDLTKVPATPAGLAQL